MWGAGFWVTLPRIRGVVFSVWGLGFRVEGLGFRV